MPDAGRMGMSDKPRTPEEIVHRAERRAHLAVEVVETLAGAAAGAAVGALGGPVGMAAGAVIGAAAGAAVGIESEKEEHVRAEHEKELDRIGEDDDEKTAPGRR